MKKRLDVAVALALSVILLMIPDTRAMLRVWFLVALDQVRVLIPLSRDDPSTLWSLAKMLLRLGLAIAPAIFVVRRRRWLIPVLILAVVFVSPISLSSCETPLGWVCLILFSAIAIAFVRRFEWIAILPFVVLLSPMPRHVLAARRTHDEGFRRQLLDECARRRGVHPANLSVERIKPPHAVTALDDQHLLMTGQGPKDDVMFGGHDDRPGSWWLRREGEKLVFDRPSEAEGRLWRACNLDGTLYSAQSARLVGARLDGTVTRFPLPSHDLDMGDTACDPKSHRVFVGEATLGSLWELDPERGRFRRREIDRVALLPMLRFDGLLVVNSSSYLNVFSPEDDRVVERTPSALLSVGFDLCPADGAAAVADETGRLRVFELRDGHYRFAWSLPVFAPRRAAWSRDCSRIAVTSSDDHEVLLIDRATRSVVDRFEAGPALREVTATGPRELSYTDACTVTSVRW